MSEENNIPITPEDCFIDDSTLIPIKMITHKKLSNMKDKVKEHTSLNLSFDMIISMLYDCIDDKKLDKKLKMLKEGIGK
jgi:hypothetical protein